MNDRFHSTLGGVPCIVVVTGYSRPTPSNRNADPLDDPHDVGEFSCHVLNEDGDPDPSLDKQITPDDVSRFYREYTGE